MVYLFLRGFWILFKSYLFSGCPPSFLEMTRTIKIVTSTYLSHSFAKQYTLQSTMPKERLSWKDTNLALSKFDGSKTKLGMVIIIWKTECTTNAWFCFLSFFSWLGYWQKSQGCCCRNWGSMGRYGTNTRSSRLANWEIPGQRLAKGKIWRIFSWWFLHRYVQRFFLSTFHLYSFIHSFTRLIIAFLNKSHEHVQGRW